MNIFDQIDTIFSGEAEDKPKWAEEILNQLTEIKTLLQEQNNSKPKRINHNFYTFIKEFRNSMKANTIKNVYPTFLYHGRKLGIDFKGYLYDKESLKVLSKDEAYIVYKYAYNHQDNKKRSA